MCRLLFGFALTLGERTSCPLDVGAGARMVAIEEERAGPDVDGEVVVRGEIMIETDQQELFDFRVAVRVRRGIERA